LRVAPPTPALAILVAQLRSVVMALLAGAALAAWLTGDRVDAAAIVVVILINTAIGFATELRARRAMEALRGLEVPHATALRDGHVAELDARELVPGDVVLVEAGQRVPADARLLDAVELRVDEAPLTGESLPVRKHPGRALPAKHVDRPVLCRRHQPRRGILRESAEGPHLHRAAEGVLHDVFRQREVVDAEYARERGNHAPRFPTEQMVAELHELSHFHDGTHLDGAVCELEDRAAGGERRRLRQIRGLNECIAADDVLRLGKWPIRDGSRLSRHQLPAAFQRMTRILDVALFSQVFQPGHPPLHLLLGLLG